MRNWIILGLILLSTQPIPAIAAEKKAPGIFARLSFSVEQFDPAKPGGAAIKCVVWNNTRSGIHVPVGYDDGYIRLESGGLNLRRQKVNPNDLKMAWVEGGKEQVIFELPLDEIFMLKKDAQESWVWDWRREPRPPLSPIHNYRQPGFRSQAEFAVRIDLGDMVLTSERVTLKIGENGQPKAEEHAQGSPPAMHTGDIPTGSLGFPLGSYLTIEGQRAEGFKTGVRTLQVDTVNGHKLDQPLALWIDNADLPTDARCVLKGYQTIRMLGVPPAVVKAAKEAGEEIKLPQAGWQVQVYFVALSAVAPKNLEIKPERP